MSWRDMRRHVPNFRDATARVPPLDVKRKKLTLAPALMLTLATSSSVEFNPLSAKRTARRCWEESGGLAGCSRRIFAECGSRCSSPASMAWELN